MQVMDCSLTLSATLRTTAVCGYLAAGLSMAESGSSGAHGESAEPDVAEPAQERTGTSG